MSRAVARRILVPTWVLSYMLKLRCLSITASRRARWSGWLEGSNVGPLGRTVELLDNPFDMLAPPTPSLTLPLKGEGK
jgi:hypothetical protein